ncbi:MAG TPA: hemerythrin domain-containing protein [Gammaproteobacteria bacterium]|nr:hemerythrin domain-containing protein [Gammaproteobacteria bacterium]
MEDVHAKLPAGERPAGTRRSFLARAAGTGLILAGGGVGRADEPEEEVTATEDLMREHGVLRRILIVYSETAAKLRRDAAAVDAKAVAAAATLFRDMGEQYHERMLEEQHVFPAVRRAGGEAAKLVDTLEAQHRRGREITAFLLDATKRGSIGAVAGEAVAGAMEGMVRMYRSHAAREDTVVFPAWKETLSRTELDELGEQFEEIEHQQLGADGYEHAVETVARVEKTLGLDSLAVFTAPAPPA